jgi:hypothetical protein
MLCEPAAALNAAPTARPCRLEGCLGVEAPDVRAISAYVESQPRPQ